MFRLIVHAAFAMLCIIVCSHVAVLGGHANSGSKAFKTEDTPMRIYIADSGKLHLIQTIVKGKINDCYMNNDKDIIEVAPEIFKDFEIKRVSQKEMNEVAKSCKLDKANWSGTSGTEAIDPGTKWCGIGNTAQNDDDLGRNRETDACCREHDKCPDYIKSGASKYGLKNKSLFLRSHCDCDDKFYSCLKNVNKWPSNIVGKIFFNLFQMKCFKNSHPVKMCRKFKGIPSIRFRCTQYELDETKDNVWQWFDTKEY